MFDITGVKNEFEVVIKNLVKTSDCTPKLAIIQIGNDFASNKYIELKKKKATSLGIDIVHHKFNKNIGYREVKNLIHLLNKDHGIIIQLPLPDKYMGLLSEISPKSDIDLLNPNTKSNLLPPTILAIDLTLKKLLLDKKIDGELVSSNLDLSNKTIAVIGQGKLVGKPLNKYLQERKAKIIKIDEFTQNPTEKSKQADIVITAVGKPNLVNNEWIKKGSMVIDAGTSESSGKLVGDVDYDSLDESITIVRPPRGIGSLTILSLFYNLFTIR